MIKKIHVCDKCGNEVITEKEKANYRTIRIGVSELDGTYPSFVGNYTTKINLPDMYLCPDCLSKLGINTKDVSNYQMLDEKDKTVEAKILDLLESLNVAFNQ